MPRVTLLTYTPDPEKTVAAAAKLCYSATGAADLFDGLDTEKAKSYVEMLERLGHESPLEHASFTFTIEGVSRAFLAQITRHRIASYSVQSQRYVKRDNYDFIVPPNIAEDEEALAEYNHIMDECVEGYQRLTEILQRNSAKKLMAEGKTEDEAWKVAEKIAIEDARFVLPNASDTKMVVTMNVRSLHNFFRLRCCNRAQWEIRSVADQMLKLCREAAPSLFANAGPSCVSDGRCSEGKMSCGKPRTELIMNKEKA